MVHDGAPYWLVFAIWPAMVRPNHRRVRYRTCDSKHRFCTNIQQKPGQYPQVGTVRDIDRGIDGFLVNTVPGILTNLSVKVLEAIL